MELKVYTIELNPPRWVRNLSVYVALPLGVLLGVAGAVRAGAALMQFHAGDKIVAEDVNTNFANLNAALDTKLDSTSLTAWQADPNVTLFGYSDHQQLDHQTTTSNWRRVGDSIEVNISTQFSATPTIGTGALAWSLPSGVMEDASKIDRAVNGPLGFGVATFGLGKVQMCSAQMSGGPAAILLECGTGNWMQIGNSAITAGTTVMLRISIPVTGW